MSDAPDEIYIKTAKSEYESSRKAVTKRSARRLLSVPLVIPSVPLSLLEESDASQGEIRAKDEGNNFITEEKDEMEERRERRRRSRKRKLESAHQEAEREQGGRKAIAAADKSRKGLLPKGSLSLAPPVPKRLAPGMSVEVLSSVTASTRRIDVQGAVEFSEGAPTRVKVTSSAAAFLQQRLGPGRRGAAIK